MTTHQSSCWKAPLHSTLWQIQEIYIQHLGGDVERKDHRPHTLLFRYRCQGSREPVILRVNRSEPTTPVSTSSRHPYDYDALMRISRVGTKEAEGFEEDLDSAEYHDATEEPVKREDVDGSQPMLRSAGFQGGIGSSSLKECIELLNATVRNSPAPLDSGVGQKISDPPQVMSPSMEGPLTEADAKPSSGSISQIASQVKDEPQSRASCDPVMETQPDSSTPTLEVKVEQKESESKEESTTSVKQEERTPEPDSEDSFTPDRVIEEVHRFLDTRGPGISAHVQPEAERETAPPQSTPRERVSVPEELGEPGYAIPLWSLYFARDKTCEKQMSLAGSIHV